MMKKVEVPAAIMRESIVKITEPFFICKIIMKKKCAVIN
jgi:hypothetical protein